LTCGYSLALSVGLLGIAARHDERVIAGWAAVAAVFYLGVIIASPRVLGTRQRRWWFAIAALINVGICAFGEFLGFIIFGVPLLAFIALFLMPYGLAARFRGDTGGRNGRRLPA
jgi:hypothetical protein